MNCFIDRIQELESLNRSFAEDSASLYVVYGRRRLGKTTLLRQFALDKPGVYHMADRSTERDAIRLLSRSMAEGLGDPGFATPDYRTFGDLFEAFDRFRPKKAFYLILDEYQYLCEIQPALSSTIQRHWDSTWSRSALTLVLCGSVMSMMYRETLSRSSPLYGRRTGQWLLRPMRFTDTAAFYESLSPLEKIRMWAICGGVPRYAELAGRERSFSAAVRSLVLSKDGPLYSEARFLLQDEVTTPNVYWSILHAVASGANRISEIAGRVGIVANQLTRYLAALSDMGLVSRKVPVTERHPKKSKRGIYQLNDHFLRLWYGCVAPFESLLELGKVDAVEKLMRTRLTHHIAWSFETICREYIEDRLDEVGGIRVGRFWRKDAEIDVVAVDASGEVVLAGECKWGVRPAGRQLGLELENKVAQIWPDRAGAVQLLLFSAAGFTEALESWAAASGTRLVAAGDLLDSVDR